MSFGPPPLSNEPRRSQWLWEPSTVKENSPVAPKAKSSRPPAWWGFIELAPELEQVKADIRPGAVKQRQPPHRRQRLPAAPEAKRSGVCDERHRALSRQQPRDLPPRPRTAPQRPAAARAAPPPSNWQPSKEWKVTGVKQLSKRPPTAERPLSSFSPAVVAECERSMGVPNEERATGGGLAWSLDWATAVEADAESAAAAAGGSTGGAAGAGRFLWSAGDDEAGGDGASPPPPPLPKDRAKAASAPLAPEESLLGSLEYFMHGRAPPPPPPHRFATAAHIRSPRRPLAEHFVRRGHDAADAERDAHHPAAVGRIGLLERRSGGGRDAIDV